MRNKFLSFFEQSNFAFANFFILIYLARHDPSRALNFSLIYSFALIYTSIMKGAAFNQYLIQGEKSAHIVLLFIKESFKNIYTMSVICFMSVFMFYKDISGDHIVIFVFYVLVEYVRVCLISTNKNILLYLVSFVVTLSPIILLVFASSNWFYIYAPSLFVLSLLFLRSLKNSNGSFSEPSLDFKSGSSMTFSSVLLIHGPLWFLYILNPIAAQYFILIRNFFQPFQIMSRAFDLIEKSNFKNFKVINLKNNIISDLFLAIPVLLILTSVGYFSFRFLYGDEMNRPSIIIFLLYSVVAYLTHSARFYENVYYKTSRTAQMISSRWVAAFSFITILVALYFLSLVTLYFILFGLILSWLILILFYNYFLIKFKSDDF